MRFHTNVERSLPIERSDDLGDGPSYVLEGVNLVVVQDNSPRLLLPVAGLNALASPHIIRTSRAERAVATTPNVTDVEVGRRIIY